MTGTIQVTGSTCVTNQTEIYEREGSLVHCPVVSSARMELMFPAQDPVTEREVERSSRSKQLPTPV